MPERPMDEESGVVNSSGNEGESNMEMGCTKRETVQLVGPRNKEEKFAPMNKVR